VRTTEQDKELSRKKKALFEALLRERGISKAAGEKISKKKLPRNIPLSFAQQRLWFIDQLEAGSSTYNVPAGLRLKGKPDVAALERSLQEIVRRHDALRTNFRSERGAPAQVISAEWRIALPVIDLSALAADERMALVGQLIGEEVGRPFDLSTGPLLRCELLRLAGQDHALVVVMHHIVCDEWSIGVMVRELSALYEAYSRGAESPLAELEAQYADFAVWQREWLTGDILEQQLAYWKRQLAGMQALDLPTDHPRSPVASHRGAVIPFSLSADLTSRLDGLSQREGVTLFMTLLAGFQLLLSRYCGQQDVAVGTVVANRNRAETEGLIGFFVNTLVLRTDLGGDPSFRELVKRVREVTLGAYAHQDLPFERLVEELSPQRGLGRTPLFQVSLVLQNAPHGNLRLGDLSLQRIGMESQQAKFDLTLIVEESGEGLSGSVEYACDLFEARTIERLSERLRVMLEQAASDPDAPISEIDYLTKEERRQILQWNETAADYLHDRCIHDLFEQQAERSPDALALTFGRMQLTYRELNERANQLAHYLRRLGVGPDTLVGICVERSFEMVVGLLGILKAGGAYLPLDPAYPRERLAFMLEDAQATALLAQRRLIAEFPGYRGRVVLLDEEWDSIARHQRRNPLTDISPGNLAYVIYTSGSTGKPKGVAVTRQNVMRLVNGSRFVDWDARDVFLQLAPVSFDASTFEIWGSLLNGARLALFPAHTPSLEELGRFIGEQGVTVAWLTAGLFHQMVEANLKGLRGVRQLLAGGEALSVTHVKTALEELGECEVINGYGPTESTTFACCCHLRSVGEIEESAPIGRPIENTKVYALDRELRLTPVGIYGELFIGGAGLACGYLNRPELTAERFVPCPFIEEAGARMYRTGDEVRWRDDGALEFRGRLDRQVKLRGYRVELGEIEAALNSHAGVRQSVVLAREDEPGEKRLVGYVVGEVGISATELREHLQRRLPEYMTPGAYVLLEELPLTPNGKVDRKALPRPALGVSEREYVAPRDAVEEIVAGIFAQLLKLERVGVDENFFELGGHSLLATQVISRVKAVFRVEFALRALFESPTVRGLARRVELALEKSPGLTEPALRRADRSRSLPLSFAQQRLWFINQLEPESTLYNMPVAMRLEGELDVAALERSLQEIVRRHEALRTSFRSEQGEPAQVISEDWRIGLPMVDLSLLAADDRMEMAERLANEDAERPFDLSRGPLLRCKLLRLAERDHALVVNMHHIVSDEWSEGILLRELTALYEAYTLGAESPLPELETQYADFAVWQKEWLKGAVLERQLNYWRGRLGGNFQELQLPTDRPRPEARTHHGAQLHFRLSAELSDALKTLCRTTHSTLYITLLAAFNALLHRYTGQDFVTVGSPIANRNRVETENLIGFFVNTLALCSDVSGNPTFRELVDRVRDGVLGAYTYQDLPFDLLVEDIQPKRKTNYNPLVRVIFEIRDVSGERVLQLPKISWSNINLRRQPAYFDLTLSMKEESRSQASGLAGGLASGLEGHFEYSTDLFDADTIEEMRRRFEYLLEVLTRNPDLRLLDIPLDPKELPEDDRELFVHEAQGDNQAQFVFD
jgi:amino acid adenylation domain-containing protein